MNLETARRVKKQLHKAGLLCEIRTSRALCELVEGSCHAMAGQNVVIKHKPDGGRVLIKATAAGFQGSRRVYEIEEVEIPDSLMPLVGFTNFLAKVPVKAMCHAFALCKNEATTSFKHPILGDVPSCERCKARIGGGVPTAPVGAGEVTKHDEKENSTMKTKTAKAAGTEQGGETMKAVCAEVNKSRPAGIKVPKGCGYLRATTVDGKSIVVDVADVVKGDNVLAGCGPYAKIEAGVKAKNHVFVANDQPVRLSKTAHDATGGATEGVGGHGHTGVKPEVAPEGKGAAKQRVPKVVKEGGTVAQGKWEGFSVSSVLRWMGKDGWKAAQAGAVAASLGWKAAAPSIRLQIASGRQGIRGEIAELSEAQAKVLRGLKTDKAA